MLGTLWVIGAGLVLFSLVGMVLIPMRAEVIAALYAGLFIWVLDGFLALLWGLWPRAGVSLRARLAALRRHPLVQGYVLGWLFAGLEVESVVSWNEALRSDWLTRGEALALDLAALALAVAAIFRRPWGWYLLIAGIPLTVTVGLARSLMVPAAQTSGVLLVLTGVALNIAWWIYFHRRRDMFGARCRWQWLERTLPIIVGPNAQRSKR